jgi:hypothetical protein
MNTEDPLILDKIKKLLNLANPNNNGSEGEIRAAFTLAQKLLKKHHLTMSQITACDDDTTSNAGMFEIVESEAAKFVANTLPKWMELLLKSVNIITETKTLIKRSQRPGSTYGNLSIVFIGDSIDVSTSTELFLFLKDTVSKLSTSHYNDHGKQHKYWRSFADGCSTKILERTQELEEKFTSKFKSSDDLDISSRIITEDDEELEEIDDDEDDEELEEIDEEIDSQINSTGFSIELYKKYEDSKVNKIKDYIDNIGAEEEKSSSRTARTEVDSYQMGQTAGKKIPLSISKKIASKHTRKNQNV